MSKCMDTGKPLISILMAIYKPNMGWLKEQLQSLNAQTYPNLRLYIRDDCSETVVYEEISAVIEKCITKFPYSFKRNEQNLGSNKTFERLTSEAEGEYFAYCDQDDVWERDKLEKLLKHMINAGVTMAYSDMSVIDDMGKQIAVSLRDVRRRLHYVSGIGLAETYFFRNCTAGCSMLILAAIAKSAMPFPNGTVCDHWLAIVSAAQGAVEFVPESLLQYRQHSSNQTGILRFVTDKPSYRKQRLEPMIERLNAYKRIAVPSEELQMFLYARLEGKILGMWKYRNFSPIDAKFEIAMRFMPEWLVRIFLRRIR